MKTRLPKLAKCPTTARSVLECASPLPLLERGCVKDQPQHRPLARTAAGRDDTAALQRGCKSATGLAHSKSWRLLVALWAFVGSWLVASAQNFTIDWFTIDGGGGTSTGGVFAVSGTIGQPDASAQPMTGGNFALIGGFWALFAVQTPDAPLLTIRLTTTNTAVVSWPSPSAGFTLQQNSDLNTANWIAAPQSVSDNGTNRFIIVNPNDGLRRFYRLSKP